MNKNEYIRNWSTKLSLTVEEITKEFNQLLESEKEIHKDLTLEQQELRAIQRTALLFKKQMRSPAVGFEGMIVAVGDCVDIIAKTRREADELYKTNPQLAVTQGVTNEEGIPLDTRREWSTGRLNPMFGKPLPENNYLRNIWGVAKRTNSEDTPKFFSTTISGQEAQDETIPVFKSIRFVAIDKSEKDAEVLKLNTSQFTKFVVDEALTLPPVSDLLKSLTTIVPLNDIEQYHTENKDNFNRLAVVEGDVSQLNLQPTTFGSRIMVLEDAATSLEDLDAKSLTCWIPERASLDFAEGSKVFVVGRTNQSKKKDDQGNQTEELGDVTLNVFGVFAIPGYKIDLPDEVKPIEDLDI